MDMGKVYGDGFYASRVISFTPRSAGRSSLDRSKDERWVAVRLLSVRE